MLAAWLVFLFASFLVSVLAMTYVQVPAASEVRVAWLAAASFPRGVLAGALPRGERFTVAWGSLRLGSLCWPQLFGRSLRHLDNLEPT